MSNERQRFRRKVLSTLLLRHDRKEARWVLSVEFFGQLP